MMDTLEEIEQTARLWRTTKDLTILLRREWDTFIFFAQHRDGYSNFVVEHLSREVPYKYFGRPRFNKEYAKAEDYTWDKGNDLIMDLIRAERIYIEAGRSLSAAMRRGWAIEELPLKELQKAYGQSENATYQYVSRQPWFKKRYSTYGGAK